MKEYKNKLKDINLTNIRLGDKQAYEDYLYGKNKTKIAKEQREKIRKIQKMQEERRYKQKKEFYKKKFKEKYIDEVVDEIKKKNEEIDRRDEDEKETIVI